jgi:hypothetical protein
MRYDVRQVPPPPRPAPSRRRTFNIGLLIGIALVLGYRTAFRHNPDSTAGMPTAERAFVNAAMAARANWLAAPNDLAKAQLPAQRAAALCRALPGLAATNWRGSVGRIDPDNFPDFFGRKTAHIVIQLTSHVSVSTPAAPLLNNPATMVEAGSPIYATAATLPHGQSVVFSGQFFPDGDNCLQENSLTEDGSMSDPQFKIHLTALGRVDS